MQTASFALLLSVMIIRISGRFARKKPETNEQNTFLAVLSAERAIHHKSMILWDCRTPERYGLLAKGRMHCSCWMCRRKSYDDPRILDKRQPISQNQRLIAYEINPEEVTEHEPACSSE